MKTKKVFYICAGIKNNKLCFLESQSNSKIDAIYDFKSVFGFEPEQISRSFITRKENRKLNISKIKYSTNSYKAIYNGWNVSAIELAEPKHYVQVFFENKVNGESAEKPQDDITHIKNIKKI